MKNVLLPRLHLCVDLIFVKLTTFFCIKIGIYCYILYYTLSERR